MAFLARTLRTSAYPRLRAEVRAIGEEGSAASRRLRGAGQIPGAVYGVGADGARNRTLIAICEKTLWRELRDKANAVENTLYELEVGDRIELVLPRQIQIRAATDKIMSLNFLRFAPGVRVEIPLRFVDVSTNPTLKRGGYLHRMAHRLACVVNTDKIPPFLDVYCAGGGPGHVFRASDARLPPGLRQAQMTHDTPLAVIKTK